MKWLTGNPNSPGLYFIRRSSPVIGRSEIFYETAYWRPGGWAQIHPSDKITHYAIIKEPRKLNENEYYGDYLGRMQCVIQAEVLPNLSTPPGKINKELPNA